MRRMGMMVSALALLVGGVPAMADPAVVDLVLRPGNKSGEGSISVVQPLYDSEVARTVIDLRAAASSKKRSSVSVGLGQRYRPGAGDFTFGAFGFFDWHDSRNSNEFRQATFGLELLTPAFELRGSAYLPTNRSADVGPVTFTTPAIAGNAIQRTVLQPREVAMDGFDVEAGLRLASIGAYDLRATAGYYRFEDDRAPTVNGYKGRVEAWSGDQYSFGLEVRDDKLNGTQAFAVIRARLDAFTPREKRDPARTRMGWAIERQPGVFVAAPDRATPRTVRTETLNLATGNFAATGTRLLFVDAAGSATGTGSFTQPFNSLTAAAAASQANDAIYVHAGSYTGNVALKDGQMLWGAGTALTATSAGVTTTLIPAGTRPSLTAATGNVVTLANNNLVTGLRITAPAGSGAANRDQFAAVYGSNVSNFTIRNNDFSGNVGTGGTSSVGVRLDNMAGVAGTRSETRHFVSNSSVLPYHATYDTGLGANNAEIISFVENSLGSFGVISADAAGVVDVVRLGTDDIEGLPILVRRDTVRSGIASSLGAAAAGELTTVTLHPTLDLYLVAVKHTDLLSNGLVEIRRRSTGEVLQRVTVGVGPDGTAISPDGRFALVANEAESLNAPGSVTLINLANAATGGATAIQVALQDQTGNFYANPAGSGQRFTDVDAPVVNGPVTHDANGLQPEYVAFSPDSRYGFITFQENNGVMVIDLATGQPANIRYFNLGNASAKPADLTNSSSNPPGIDFSQTLPAIPREPDGIAAFTIGGQLYFVITEEGDTTQPGVNTNQRYRGGRTISVFNATTGQFVSDLGGTLDQALLAQGNAAMQANPAIYGDLSQAPRYYPDSRSRRGGGEPEVLTVFEQGGRTYAMVGMERGASIALVDLTNPAAPTLVTLGLLPRDMTRVVDTVSLAANPEGIVTLRASASGRRYAYSGLEDNGKVAIWRFVPN